MPLIYLFVLLHKWMNVLSELNELFPFSHFLKLCWDINLDTIILILSVQLNKCTCVITLPPQKKRVIERFHCPQKFSLQSIPLLHTWSQATSDRLAVTINSFGLFKYFIQMQSIVCTCLSWLLLLSILTLRLIIHIVAYIHFLHFSLPIHNSCKSGFCPSALTELSYKVTNDFQVAKPSRSFLILLDL